MADSKLRDLSADLAVNVIKMCDGIRSLVNQLENSSTSIGANIREAQYAHGKADFIAKLQIALKEANETGYWLELRYKTDYIGEEDYNFLESTHPKTETVRIVWNRMCR